MSKVSSAGIRVYPCGNRSADIDINARFTTEYNLISIVNRLVDMKSFCVDDVTDNMTSFSFNINGYLFTISGADNIKDIKNLCNSDKKYVYAGICVDEVT